MKVSIIILIYNAKKYIEPLFDSIFNQTYKNFEVLAIINGNSDGSKEFIVQKYPSVKIIDPHNNLWFSKGNNLGIKKSTGDLIYCVNQDVILEPDNLQKIVEVFKDEKVGAATGKVLRYDFVNNKKTNIIDTTGIVMNKAGRGRDRGQNEIDQGQFDKFQIPNSKFETVFGVSGAVAMYRRSALKKIKYCPPVFAGGAKQSNCIIIHGCPSREEDLIDITRMNAKHWIPWLAQQLNKNGIEAFAPLMPNPWAPIYGDWKNEIEKYQINENTIIVAHSCGAAFIIRWLGETKRKISKLVLVAGAKVPSEKSCDELKKLYDFEIDPSIKNIVGRIVLFLGGKEETRHIQGAEIYSKILGGEIINVPRFGHFTFEDMGTTEFPELLNEITNIELEHCYPSSVTGVTSSPVKGEEQKEEIQSEYFDEDFVAYWEDVDLSWRLNNAGFKNVYVPNAISYHGRTAGSAKGGYLKIINFIKHHKQISSEVRRLNYKNHILMYIKNAPFIHPLFILREIAMLGYIILFEISTLKVIPELFRQIPKVLKKRKFNFSINIED